MTRRRGFQINQRGIDNHVKKIAQGYEKAWRRHGPSLAIETDTASGEPTVRWAPEGEQTMTGTASRSQRVQSEFLHWFATHHENAPGWRPFLSEVRTVDQAEVSEKELRTAVRLLVADGLFGGPPSNDPRENLPALLQLTPEGERCEAVYGGDVARWERARSRGLGASVYNDYRDQRDQRTYASNTSGIVVSHSPNAEVHHQVEQSEIDLPAIRRSVQFLLVNLDDLTGEGFDGASRESVAEQGSAVVMELQQPDPDPTQVRSLAERLNNTLLAHPLAAGVAGGVASGTLSGPVTAMLSAALGLPPG